MLRFGVGLKAKAAERAPRVPPEKFKMGFSYKMTAFPKNFEILF